jgi:SAM-dependent methyltransferase
MLTIDSSSEQERSIKRRLGRILDPVRRLLFERLGLHVELREPRPAWPGERHRFDYQRQCVDFDLRPGDRVLDVGNGGDPFPYATVLVDRYLDLNRTRHEPLERAGKTFVLADIHDLPFADKSFDYVSCAHVLEVVDDPLAACRELMRVGRRGFIETPTAGKDVLFAWARGEQKWHVVSIGTTLCFFEYSERQLDGIRSSVWRDLIFSPRRNAIQDVFYNNLDVFNVLFTWTDRFSVFVFRLDGGVEMLHAHGLARRASRPEPVLRRVAAR